MLAILDIDRLVGEALDDSLNFLLICLCGGVGGHKHSAQPLEMNGVRYTLLHCFRRAEGFVRWLDVGLLFGWANH